MRHHLKKAPSNKALQLTKACSGQQVRAARHFVPHRASVIYGPSQLNAVFCGPLEGSEVSVWETRRWQLT
jgi:hypothetical protein